MLLVHLHLPSLAVPALAPEVEASLRNFVCLSSLDVGMQSCTSVSGRDLAATASVASTAQQTLEFVKVSPYLADEMKNVRKFLPWPLSWPLCNFHISPQDQKGDEG